jgi:hypothetical protein
MLQPQDIARLIEEFLGLLPATVGDTDAKANEFAFGDRSR